MAFKTIEEWAYDRQVSQKYHGKSTYMGVEAKYNLEKAKRNYEEELRYHNLNPSNPSSAMAVKKAKEALDYWQMRFDNWD